MARLSLRMRAMATLDRMRKQRHRERVARALFLRNVVLAVCADAEEEDTLYTVVAYWLLEQSWRPVVINAPRAYLTRYSIDFPIDSPWYRIKEMPHGQGDAAEDRWREMAMIQHFGFDSAVFGLLFLSFAPRWEEERPSSHMGRARLCDGRDALAIALSHIRGGGEAEPHQLIFGLPPSTFSDYLLPALRALHSVCADEPLCAIRWMSDADRGHCVDLLNRKYPALINFEFLQPNGNPGGVCEWVDGTHYEIPRTCSAQPARP